MVTSVAPARKRIKDTFFFFFFFFAIFGQRCVGPAAVMLQVMQGLPRLPSGSAGPDRALFAQTPLFVPGGQARERAVLAGPGKAFYGSDADHDHDHVLQVARVSCHVGSRTEYYRGHDNMARMTGPRQPACYPFQGTGGHRGACDVRIFSDLVLNNMRHSPHTVIIRCPVPLRLAARMSAGPAVGLPLGMG